MSDLKNEFQAYDHIRRGCHSYGPEVSTADDKNPPKIDKNAPMPKTQFLGTVSGARDTGACRC